MDRKLKLDIVFVIALSIFLNSCQVSINQPTETDRRLQRVEQLEQKDDLSKDEIIEILSFAALDNKLFLSQRASGVLSSYSSYENLYLIVDQHLAKSSSEKEFNRSLSLSLGMLMDLISIESGKSESTVPDHLFENHENFHDLEVRKKIIGAWYDYLRKKKSQIKTSEWNQRHNMWKQRQKIIQSSL